MGRDAQFRATLTRGEMERRRLLAADDLRSGMKQADVARKYNVSRASVSRWSAALRRRGKQGLHATKARGRAPALSKEARRKIPAILKRGAQAYGYATDLWTIPRLVRVVERELKVHVSRSIMHRVLRDLGFSWQRPDRRARERNEGVIQRWIERDWPSIVKKGRDSTP